MKLYRYMSFKEFQKMASGMDMKHSKNSFKSRTDSKGFCFIGEKTSFVSSDCEGNQQEFTFSPEECHQFLDGIVTDDVLVEFEADENLLQKTTGIYADPIFQEWDCYISIAEFCAMSYNRDDFIPLRYAIQDDFLSSNNIKWYNFN